MYDSGGTVNGAEFQVNTFAGGPQYMPRAAALTGGGYVVVWVSDV